MEHLLNFLEGYMSIFPKRIWLGTPQIYTRILQIKSTIKIKNALHTLY